MVGGLHPRQHEDPHADDATDSDGDEVPRPKDPPETVLGVFGLFQDQGQGLGAQERESHRRLLGELVHRLTTLRHSTSGFPPKGRGLAA